MNLTEIQVTKWSHGKKGLGCFALSVEGGGLHDRFTHSHRWIQPGALKKGPL